MVLLGVDVNAPNSDGSTALHVAATVGSRGVVQYLTDHRADVNAVDSLGNAPLNVSTLSLKKFIVLFVACFVCPFHGLPCNIVNKLGPWPRVRIPLKPRNHFFRANFAICIKGQCHGEFYHFEQNEATITFIYLHIKTSRHRNLPRRTSYGLF